VNPGRDFSGRDSLFLQYASLNCTKEAVITRKCKTWVLSKEIIKVLKESSLVDSLTG